MESDFDKNELDYVRQYEAAGYTEEFQIINEKLQNLETKRSYSPDEITTLIEHLSPHLNIRLQL